MKKLIVANWKMNPDSLRKAEELLLQVKVESEKEKGNIFDLVICPPYEYLEPLIFHGKKGKLKFKFGAQDVFYENKGAYTGEISPKMLKNLGVEYVIVGHSERRRLLNESDAVINKKVLAALSEGLKVILCVGENSSVRDKGEKVIENYIRSQLEKDLKGIESLKLKIKNLIIAYEPVWAIGTGNNDTPEDAVKVTGFIKKLLDSSFKINNLFVLYGGSVSSKNINDFLKNKEIDGALVGGASIDKREFPKLLNNIENETSKTKKVKK